ncbi:MAG TPA: T9SS type A sorting domain-containing protein, partial [candidate division WOR-3 bacterium]|nr:T9SS type A sorting domain-containing protein [candidate division WOR-3 bacterium]
RYLFSPETLQVEVVANETTIVNFSLEEYSISPPFSTDFEENNGGFASGAQEPQLLWTWVDDTLPPGHSGTRYWQAIGENNMPDSKSWLYAPRIDLSSVSSALIFFYHSYYLYHDYTANVQVSPDGLQNWTTIFSCTPPNHPYDWVPTDSISLNAYAGDTIYLRFELIWPPYSRPSWWRIDDFYLLTGSGQQGVNVNEENKRFRLSLSQNIPNPVYTTTMISYVVPEKTKVNLNIYDSSGRLVNTLVDEIQNPGHYNVVWNCKDGAGKRLSSGIYFYCLRTEKGIRTRKFVLIK